MFPAKKKYLLLHVLLSFNIWLYNTFFRGCFYILWLWDFLNSKLFLGLNLSLISIDFTYKKNIFLTLLQTLKLNHLCQFNILIDIVGIDYKQTNCILFSFLSTIFNYRFQIIKLNIGFAVNNIVHTCISVSHIFLNAN